jgi:hypothetical protein
VRTTGNKNCISMKNTKLFAALCCTAMLFAACEKNEDKISYDPDAIAEDDLSVVTEGDLTISGSENGHNYADLGLSVKWATMNVGATALEEYGDGFAWGETTTKDTYNWSNYKFAKGNYSTLTKYCNDTIYGYLLEEDGKRFTDELTTIEAADDAATANWGGKWRMPTVDEWNELISNCTLTWSTLNDKVGYEVKAANGNSIFIPVSDASNADGKIYGYYWSSSLYTNNPSYAQYVYFHYYTKTVYDENKMEDIVYYICSHFALNNSLRYCGYAVRPVVAE